ncbi:MAG: lipopolysaccharide biosynthesis protein [Syntrophaceae bacterium]|nr:lipopolysaccharide biosynthesis protein [Syntrophaceae bacterium]
MTKNTLPTRIFHGLAANSFGQMVTIIIQVISVPLFIRFWGVHLYGEWLVISAIPAYLALTDIGFGSVAANEMTMLVSKENRQEALEVFQSTWIFICIASALLGGLILAGIWTLPLERWLKLSLLTHRNFGVVTSLLAIYVLFGLQGGLLQAGYRCEGNYARGVLAGNILRLIEFASVTVGVCLGAGVIITALIFLTMRLIGTAFVYLDLKKYAPWVHFGVQWVRYPLIRRLAQPAVAYMAFPIGNALSLQGMVIVVSSILGPVAVVVFSTVRTLTRFALQVMGMINNTVWPEISMAYGAGDKGLMRRLHRGSCQASVWLSGLAVLALSLVGREIMKIWTDGKVIPDPLFLHLMLFVIVANSLWYTSSVIHVAINKHRNMAVAYLLGTSTSLALAYYFLIPRFGLNGAPLALFAIDIAMSVYVIQSSLKLVGDSLGPFLAAMVKPGQLISLVGSVFFGKKCQEGYENNEPTA